MHEPPSSICPTLMIEFLSRGIQYTPISTLCSPRRPEKMTVQLPQMLTTEPSPKLDGTLHYPVKLREHFAMTRHVVRRARLEVPALKTVVDTGSCADERLCHGLDQVDQLLLRHLFDSTRRRRRIFNLLHHGHQERQFLIVLGLGQIRPLLWLVRPQL
jgi:hypothetical protein